MNNGSVLRFWGKVRESNGCWLWTAAVDRLGYGRFNSGPGRTGLAHRLAWELLVGDIPTGMFVDHDHPERGCHNPTCVNPDHLCLVSTQVNNARRRGAMRNSKSKTRGVYWCKETQSWAVTVSRNNDHYWGGRFKTLEEAAQAAINLRKNVYEE